MEQTLYHKLLRVSVVVTAFVLMFDSGYLLPETSFLSQGAQQYVASVVSIGASVESTELNVITAELTKRSVELDQREAMISDREISVGLSSSEQVVAANNLSTYILSTILFILLVLIVLNYSLDYIRVRSRQEEQVRKFA